MQATGALYASLPFPAAVVRWGAKRSLRQRLRKLCPDPNQDSIQRCRIESQVIADRPNLPQGVPNTAPLERGQLPLAFWQRVLGARLHAGAALWPRRAKDIHQAEGEWCKVVAGRSELASGQRVLEVGAHPGSLARWARAEIPGLEVTLLALEPSGRRLLEDAVARLGPTQASVATGTLGDFSPSRDFDRIIAVEALAQVSNPRPLIETMLSWLTPAGRLFLQIAVHWRDSYHFGPDDEHTWMLPEAADGALFPGARYLGELEKRITVIAKWELSGEHYERTARAWRARLENQWRELLAILAASDQAHPRRTLRAWRNALLAQEVMYGYHRGQEWCLTQLLLGHEPSC